MQLSFNILFVGGVGSRWPCIVDLFVIRRQDILETIHTFVLYLLPGFWLRSLRVSLYLLVKQSYVSLTLVYFLMKNIYLYVAYCCVFHIMYNVLKVWRNLESQFVFKATSNLLEMKEYQLETVEITLQSTYQQFTCHTIAFLETETIFK